ncbi:ABC transporter permease [Zavarzinia compransoris]|uniref:ABC transporter permease n=1 Tax=Zavarzinia marina TaxID=2911065 RepID=UPI001F3F97CD|nr:ABC transporter permease [Zavarzinia marina]MCF4165323.1 ABC transporter permease [Zavarzinia marina]
MSRTDARPRPAVFLLRWFDAAMPVLTFVVLVLFWEAVVRVFSIPAFLLPAPSAILSSMVSVDVGQWAKHVWATLRVALMGYVLAILVSVPLAVALATSRSMSRSLYPLLVVVQSMPVVAIAPIIVVSLGAGDLPRVLIAFLITFFPIVVSTTTGLMATPPELIELSRSLRAGRSREIWHIRLPYAMPHVFSALRICTTLSLIGAVVAEFVTADKGLGYYISFSTSNLRMDAAFAGLALMVTLSLGFFRLIDLVQRVLAPWSRVKG